MLYMSLFPVGALFVAVELRGGEFVFIEYCCYFCLLIGRDELVAFLGVIESALAAEHVDYIVAHTVILCFGDMVEQSAHASGISHGGVAAKLAARFAFRHLRYVGGRYAIVRCRRLGLQLIQSGDLAAKAVCRLRAFFVCGVA